MIDALRAAPVTWALIGLNLLVFADTAIQPDPFGAQSLIDLGAIYGWAIGVDGAWWRLFSGIFLHGGPTHLLLNMISLYIVGQVAETLMDRWSYLLLYLASGIAGGAVSVGIHPDGLSVGASGAIFGILGAILGYVIAHRRQMGSRFGALMREFGVILVLNLVLGLTIPGIDMSAHIGGLLVGIVGGSFMRTKVLARWWSVGVILGALIYVIGFYPARFTAQGLLQ